jgi:hypothetical protein
MTFAFALPRQLAGTPQVQAWQDYCDGKDLHRFLPDFIAAPEASLLVARAICRTQNPFHPRRSRAFSNEQ